MLRLNPGTVSMKVFVQTWAFLGWISLVSPMNAWGTLPRGVRAVLAKKRMSDLLQQRVSFQSMEQQQFEWKKHAVYIYICIYIYTYLRGWCFVSVSHHVLNKTIRVAFLRGGIPVSAGAVGSFGVLQSGARNEILHPSHSLQRNNLSFLLLMEEIPNNHLRCIKSCKEWDKINYQP